MSLHLPNGIEGPCFARPFCLYHLVVTDRANAFPRRQPYYTHTPNSRESPSATLSDLEESINTKDPFF